MTEHTRAALSAHLDRCGRDGPPPGPGLWVVETRTGPRIADVDADGTVQLHGSGWIVSPDVQRTVMTRHAPLLPEPLEVHP